MEYREASIADIPAMHIVRLAVKENALSNPNIISETHYVDMLETRGKGWVCFFNHRIVGFSIIDLTAKNVWALFVSPEFEKQGIGKKLHDLMLNCTFSQQEIDRIWLTTGAKTRAENFYRYLGWQKTGIENNGEIRFEMSKEMWLNITSAGF